MDRYNGSESATTKKRAVCLTELSTVALIGWALGLSAVLWLAIVAVL